MDLLTSDDALFVSSQSSSAAAPSTTKACSKLRRLLTTANEQDAKLLRRKAKRVKNVQSTEVILAIQDMKRIARQWEHETGLRAEGLAASQIGVNLRILILRKNDWMSPPNPEGMKEHFLDQDANFDTVAYKQAHDFYREWQRCYGGVYDPWFVMINPVVLQSEGEQNSIESCLSVPVGSFEVVRPTHVAFKYGTDNGKFSGVHLAKNENAIKFMHEYDHTIGKLVDEVGVPVIGAKAEAL